MIVSRPRKEIMDDNNPRKQDTQEETSPQIVVKRGRTSFFVSLHFAKEGKETIESKIKRMILKDAKGGNF